MAIAYRAHFAFIKNPRVTSYGLETSAVYGFINSVFEILSKEAPSHIAVVFDTNKPTFRHEMFEAYKGQREEMPEGLRKALPFIRKCIEAMNIPVITLDGFEADDIIGTLAHKAVEHDFQVFMMTPDKDFGQLVRENVYIYKPARLGNDIEVLGVQDILEKWEIERIDQVTDILGLWGDAVDNIPGVPGVGEKTAKSLIKTYGTVENILQNVHQLKGKQKENFENFADQAILSKKLATIPTDVPIEFDEVSLRVELPDAQKLGDLFKELEFRTLYKRMFGDSQSTGVDSLQASSKNNNANNIGLFSTEEHIVSAEQSYKTAENTPHSYHLVDTNKKIEELLDLLSKSEVYCFDTETDGLDALLCNIVGMSFCTEPTVAYYLPLSENREEVVSILNQFKPIFSDTSKTLIGQNCKYDLHVLDNYGIEVENILFDTMLAHYLLEPDMRHNMDYLAETYLGYQPISITTLIGKKGKDQASMRDISVKLACEYASEDADITFQLYEVFKPMLAEFGVEKLFNEVEMPLVTVLQSMEKEGISLDTKALAEYSKLLEEESLIIEKEIYKLAGFKFNVNSPKQLGEVLFNVLKLDPKAKKTKTGQYKTDEEVLQLLAIEHSIAAKVIDFRQIQKLKSTYIDALPLLINPNTGRIHTSYNQAVAATGRLSSNNPNLQNIPIRTERGKEVRKAFIKKNEDYTLLSADYSQIELRIISEISGETQMLADFKAGLDIHTATASKVYGIPVEEVTSDMRRNAKMVNFGIIYGISAFGLSQRLGVPRGEAAKLIEQYFATYPSIKTYMDKTINEAKDKGYVETLLGRRRYLRDINSGNATVRGFAERNAINAPIQGSAADMIKLAMIRIHKSMTDAKLQSKMLLQVHDELVFDAKLDELDQLKAIIKDGMENALPMSVPILVEMGTGDCWLDAH